MTVSNCYNRPDNIAWEIPLDGINWTVLSEDTGCVDVFIGIIPQLALFRVEFECGECEVESEIFVFNNKCKSSENLSIEEENLFDVFPNPTTNILKINYSEGYSNGSIIQIIDINGRLVYEKNLNKSINIEGLQSGTYMLKITNEDRIAYAKFVKI